MKNSILSLALLAAISLTNHTATASEEEVLDRMIITPMIHASVLLQYKDTAIYVDPWSAIDLSDFPKADIILITDDSGHHLDIVAVEKLIQPHTSIISPQSGEEKLPYTNVLDNGESWQIGNVMVESIAAYDIIPGAPEHPKGEASGYVITLDDVRIYFAGVTECVPEVKELTEVDIAFMPMNIPVGRMTPQATADCIKEIGPKIAYVYHFDQSYALQVSGSSFGGWELPGGLTVDESILELERLLEGSGIEIRHEGFYPDFDSGER